LHGAGCHTELRRNLMETRPSRSRHDHWPEILLLVRSFLLIAGYQSAAETSGPVSIGHSRRGAPIRFCGSDATLEMIAALIALFWS